MRGQVVIEAIGEAVHQRLQPRRTLGVLRLHVERVDEELHTQVAPERALPFHFRGTPHRRDVIGLHAIEVILGLRIHHTEHGVGVGFAVHVRDAVLIAHDGHAGGLLLPLCRLSRQGNRREQQGRGEE